MVSPPASARRQSHAFDPRRHARELVPLLSELAGASELDARAIDRAVRRHPKEGRGLFRKSEILAGYRVLGGAARFGGSETEFAQRLRLRPVRTLSGVTPVTVLTRPYPCPGRCVFCPNDVRMPKSYLADEPGAQRAEDNRFDPYLQTWNRLRAYREIGHPTAKVELIVLGGTWSHYPESYQRWFVTRCLDALSDFGAGIDGRADAGAAPQLRAAPQVAGRALDGQAAYNESVGKALARLNGHGLLHESERAKWERLEAAQRRNETAGARCVGLSLETRPDAIDVAEALRLRRLGATKIQLGVQSLDDAVLAANRRGHDVEASRTAFRLLRRLGFKLQAHWMPNLLGATAAGDAEDFDRLFDDPGLRPDELKLYPTLLVESAELARHHASGAWRPYSDATLIELLSGCLLRAPEWVRVTRVVRDFSSHDIAAGTHRANLREAIEARIARAGLAARDIRAREIRGRAFDPGRARLRERRYAVADATEWFLSFESPEDLLIGFLRLSLPTSDAPLAELEGAALVREVHVYGASLPMGVRGTSPQHAGFGRRLVERAAALAREHGSPRLAVISAVGTRAWYRSLGFADGALYQLLDLKRGGS